jgi:hypothetical protein
MSHAATGSTARDRLVSITRLFIPITYIPTIVGVAWWGSGISHDVVDTRQRGNETAAVVARHTTLLAEGHESTAVVQAQLVAIRAQLDRMERTQLNRDITKDTAP